jgi:hypothetical protein
VSDIPARIGRSIEGRAVVNATILGRVCRMFLLQVMTPKGEIEWAE